MQTHFAHMQLNVRTDTLPFYRDLMAYLGWQTIYGNEEMLGVGSTGRESLWFIANAKNVENDYDGPGMNHLGIGAESQADVDAVASFLTERGVALLFETPRHRPDFAQGEEQTYYQVMFESPDRILFEVVYSGPKSA